MVQKGREDDLRPGKSIPRYRGPTSTAVLVSGHRRDSRVLRKSTLFKVNAALSEDEVLWPDSQDGAFMRHGPGGPRARQAFNGSRQDGRRGSRHDAERRPAARATVRRVGPHGKRKDDPGRPLPARRSAAAG